MLLQQSPFRGEDEDEIYDAILADEPLYPIHMPRDSVSILQKLLTREPDQRLGSGPTDAQEIMSQPFFRNINWDDVYHKRIQPPFQPQITNATDTSNFDSEFTSVTPVLHRYSLVSSPLITAITKTRANNASSSVTSYARRIPRFLILCRLCLNESTSVFLRLYHALLILIPPHSTAIRMLRRSPSSTNSFHAARGPWSNSDRGNGR